MSGSNAIPAAATVCSVSGQWDPEQQTGGVFAFRHGPHKSPACAARLSSGSCSPSGSNSWRTARSGSALKPSPRGGFDNFRVCGGDPRRGEAAGKTRELSAAAVGKIEVPRGSTKRRVSSGSELAPVALHHRRMSALSSFRAATFELVSCYSRLSGEIQKHRKSRGKRQGLGRVKALGDDSIYEREDQRWTREEQRWLREEQRWLREENRWLREEQKWAREEARWTAANQALQEEVKSLTKELEALRGQRGYGGEITDISLRNLAEGMRTLLQALAIPGSEDLPLLDSRGAIKQILDTVPRSGAASTTYVVGTSEATVSPVSFVASPDKDMAIVTPEIALGKTPDPRSQTPASPNSSKSANGASSNSSTTSSSKSPTTTKFPTTTANKRTMRSGMEGDDVKELQDALSELGFYSGEEDIEFSVFSDGTERAVKTWQSTVGVPEDGKVTKELMAALLAEAAGKTMPRKDETKKTTKSNTQPSTKVESTSRTKQPTQGTKHQEASDDLGKREIDRYERSNAQETGTGSSRRVYLLGENRWEEPDRVMKKQDEERRKKNGSSLRIDPQMTVRVDMCHQCRSVGTMLCTECEGTGDLNVEEQFLEWIEEGEAKCPYCEGSGAVQCDVCFGQLINIQ